MCWVCMWGTGGEGTGAPARTGTARMTFASIRALSSSFRASSVNSCGVCGVGGGARVSRGHMSPRPRVSLFVWVSLWMAKKIQKPITFDRWGREFACIREKYIFLDCKIYKTAGCFNGGTEERYLVLSELINLK